ncbi:glycosyltransferase family 2 protein [Mangrovibrevibacter kandeliae]|uniref:glycosyltransferase family 2 protein n=1 Tax=Mangrovibrevibacter kandeliae TaxID=2968473 RepID=UPI002117F4AC|nr:glycosyltransferase family 2 protein [Aurantimonas sp. CSK15Z-1]MCQ8782811.1 glycosyltransferase family 2 protein [Aurantimonas sp. CSK15Z-1]
MTGSDARRELSIVIPAYFEEERLEQTTLEAVEAAEATLDAFEIIIVNDGSTDGTGAIADRLAAADPRISVIHFPVNRGVGAAYRAGLAQARFANLTLVPGDRAFEPSGVHRLFQAVGQADMIISYRANPAARIPIRRLLSRICTFQLRLTTRCQLKDGHSLYVWPVAEARKVRTPPDYSYHLVTLVTLLQRVRSYAEVPVTLTPKPDEQSRVLRWGVVLTLARRLSILTVRSFLRFYMPKPRRIEVVSPSSRMPAMSAANSGQRLPLAAGK